MTDRKQFTHRQIQMAGPAVLSAYDDVNDYYYRLGYLDNLALSRVSDSVYQREYHVSRSVAIDAITREEDWALKFSIKERLNPDWQRLVFKNCGTPVIHEECSLQVTAEKMRMFRRHAKFIDSEGALWGSELPGPPPDVPPPVPPPVNVIGHDGAGGAIPAGTYVIVVEAEYIDHQNAGIAVRSEYMETGAIIVGASRVTLTWDAPAGTYEPHHYNIYVYNTTLGQTRADAQLTAVVGNEQPAAIVFDEFQDFGDYPGDVDGASFIVTDSTGEIEYVNGDDYTIDISCGIFKLVEDGDIQDGQLIIIYYAFVANPYYQQSIGPGDRNPRILHFVIKWFKDDERINPAGRGCEIHLYHVHAESGFEWLFDEMNFESGWDQDYRVLLDSGTGKYGDIFTFHKYMESWELFELSGISDYTNDEACDLVSS